MRGIALAINRNRVAQEAEKLLQQGKTDAAIAQYEILIKDNPRDLNTVNKIGDLCLRLGRKKEAIHQFNKIGESYAKDGFFLKAIAIYKKILKVDSGHVDSYDRLADLYARQGLVLEARSQYQAVAERYLKAGNSDKAIHAYRELTRLDPDNLRQREKLAELMAKGGRAPEAAEELMGLGAALERKGQKKEARSAYEKAAKLQPPTPAVSARLAGTHLADGDREGALRILDEALARPGDQSDALILLAEIKMQDGEAKEAEAALVRAMSASPTRLDLMLKLAQVRIAMHDTQKAFSAIADHVPAMVNDGHGAQVAELLESVLGLEASHIGALRALAEVYAGLKEEDKSLECLRRLLDQTIESAEYDEGQRLAESILKRRPGDEPVRAKLQLIQSARSHQGAAGAAPARSSGSTAQELRGEPAVDATPEPVAGSEDSRGEPVRLDSDDEDFITEHMTEADVFVKYGLADRAIEQLAAVTGRFPSYAPAHEKLKEIHMEAGNREGARDAMVQLVRSHLAGNAVDEAEAVLAELSRFDPGCAEIPELTSLLTPGATLVEPAAAMTAGIGASELADEAEFDVEEMDEPEADERASSQAPAGASPSGPDAHQLQEIDVYLETGLRDEAVGRLRTLADSFGSHPEIVSRMKRAVAMPAPPPAAEEDEEIEISLEEEAEDTAAVLEESAAMEPGPAPTAGGPMEDLLDLASEIDAALGGSPGDEAIVAGAEASPEGSSLEEIVEAFKKGVELQVDAEDYDTHYNLGIAYREMGLMDEAIGEFQFAAKDTKLLVDCCSMLGLCFRDKGMHSLAEKWYRRGIETGGRDEETLLGLRYDLADLLAGIGENGRALDLFSEIFGTNSKYRDVAARLKEIQAKQGK